MGRLEAKFVVGACSAAVFANEVGSKAKPIVVRTVAVSRTYKDKEGRFQSVTTFPTNEVPKLMVALAKAYAYLTSSAAVALTSPAEGLRDGGVAKEAAGPPDEDGVQEEPV